MLGGDQDDGGLHAGQYPRVGKDLARPWLSGACGCGSTSPTTAAASTAGRPSPACAPCRATSRRRWPPCCGCRRSRVVCAGRTDTGVHARGQVVHVDVPRGASRRRPAGRRRRTTPWRGGSTACWRPTSGCAGAVAAAGRASTRGSRRVWRRYAYRVADDAGARRPADARARARVAAAARPRRHGRRPPAALLGEHDFAAFCKRREGATTSGPCSSSSWERDRGRASPSPTVRADAFCHSMVRSLVGCLLAVGEGRRPPAWAGRGARAGAALAVGGGRPGARADAGGGRLPARRRARRAGERAPGGGAGE